MKNFFIIHGSDGHSKENWFPWMREELKKRGYECIVPDFPCEDGHNLLRWYEVLDVYRDMITPETVFIAHSRGVSFVLNMLRDYDYNIDSIYMVGGFIENLWAKPDQPPTSFFAKPFDIDKAKKQCKNFINYQSNNDPYIPIEHGRKVSKVLNAKYVLVKGAGHFNTGAGYTEFPKLLEVVLSRGV